MGQAVIRQLAETPGVVISGGFESAGSKVLGEDIGVQAGLAPVGAVVTDDPAPVVAEVDGIIDFSTPETSLRSVALAAQARIVCVVGTTGFAGADEERIRAAAHHGVIVKSGNMSLGITLLAGLVRHAAGVLGEAWDIEITEFHHRHKVDAPSGTALLLGEAAATGRGVSFEEVVLRGRDGQPGLRPEGGIGFSVLRGGSVTGNHDVIFATEKEHLRLAHVAEDRSIFARGAVAACLWGRGRSPGLYTMEDVLNLSDRDGRG